MRAAIIKKNPHFRPGPKLGGRPLRSLIVLLFFNVYIEFAYAHGGGLDNSGCHHDRKVGEYHCHRGELTGRVFASRTKAEEALRAEKLTPLIELSFEGSYNRKLYGVWIDEDGDCQYTRHEILIAESTQPVTFDKKRCRVLSGQWEDPYTGRVFNDPRLVDIDHFIPLAEVHRSGGYSWTGAQRRRYTNDLSNPDTLIVVSASANRSKGDKDPAHWLPPNQAFQCEYLKTWVEIKRYWELSSDLIETRFLANNDCLKANK